MNSKDDLLEPASDSFWEVDSYKRVVKRTEDGLHSCNELMKLIQERSEIELKYATKLQAWNKKWNESIEKSKWFMIMIMIWTLIMIIIIGGWMNCICEWMDGSVNGW